ncbi:MAG TPA: NTP transferase domain-containing protein [Bacteroidota bacterium]|nr:NTP transferase domain-containing protein [Bacteroidota bacterium]
MKAGIIAAGEGSRLKSEGVLLPKPLVRVDGTPLIERLLRSYAHCGIEEVVCIVNEYSLEVKRFVESNNFGVPVKFVVKTTLSSMHSLIELSPHLAGGKFLLSTVDSIFKDSELSNFIEHSRGTMSSQSSLAVTDFIDDENPLYVHVDGGMNITSFGKRGINDNTPWVTGGLYILSPDIFRETDAILKSGIERLRNYLGYLLSHGYNFDAFPFSKIVDVDHVGDIATAERLLKSIAN